MLASETDKHYGTGMVAGAFDLFHIGHLNLLRRAKERCDVLIAGVLEDGLISRQKGKWPVVPQEERLAIVQAISYVDRAVLLTHGRNGKLAMWEDFRFDAFFSGDDWKGDPGWEAEEAQLAEKSASVLYFPYTKKTSSTHIQDAILPPAVKATKPVRVVDPARAGEEFAEGFHYLFPFHRVEKGERVVLYGAGDVGEEYLRQVEALEYCRVVAVADRGYAQKTDFHGRPVWNPESLMDRAGEYDRIVIASTRYYGNIATLLRQWRIPVEKMV